MSRKAKYCDDCKHFGCQEDEPEMYCLKGHKPRFYPPKSPMDMDWGWKRRCKDFKLSDNVRIIDVDG